MKKNENHLNIVGDSYLSYIAASHLSAEKRDISIIDDPSYRFGEIYGSFISELDKYFMHAWGKDKEIGPLKNIEKYLTPKPLEFSIDHLKICLGQAPFLNIIELLRKVPSFFKGLEEKDKLIKDIVRNSGQFDDAYYNFCRLVGANIFRYKSFQNLLIEDFLAHCPDSFKKIYEVFADAWFTYSKSFNEGDRTKKSLMYLWRTIYQNKLSVKTSEFEVFHLILVMLGPTYQIDQQLFKDDCKKEKGFNTFKGQVLNFTQRFGNVRSIEHSSKNGPMETNQLFILCSTPPEDKVELARIYPGYTSVLLRVKNCKDYDFINDKLYVFGRSGDLGTRMSFWTIHRNNGELWISAKVKKENAYKIEFDLPFVKEKLTRDLAYFYPHKNLRPQFIEKKQGHDFYYQESNWNSFTRVKLARIPVSKKFKIFDANKHRFRKIKNANYFGPLKDGPLGLLSLLMELKDCQKLIPR
ncbi:MAG: hypothetical protein OEY33_03985 [Bdellovibrionales bacterium]|nr:hypothetical protein [Bdellovibrionales bacterium]